VALRGQGGDRNHPWGHGHRRRPGPGGEFPHPGPLPRSAWWQEPALKGRRDWWVGWTPAATGGRSSSFLDSDSAIMKVGRAHPTCLNMMSLVFRGFPSSSKKSLVAQASSLCRRRLKPAATFFQCSRLTLNVKSLPDITESD